MKLGTGTRLGPYEILAPIGAGGMGEVFRARDARLGRDVAIKILPESLADDARALARFEQEARAVAALSHPNILAIHDFGREVGVVYAVTELLEGESLDRRIAREALPWKKAVEIGAAMADGLASAHARGIVHRDLKPANVFMTRDGLVKILDFGLARRDPFVPVGGETAAATEKGPETAPGTVMGSVGYMSPEQVRGDTADTRSDIFSLGCILHEMLSGQRAFRERTTAETLASILRDSPADLAGSGRDLPPSLSALVRRCLEKSPDERFQSARDLAFGLREILGSSTATTASALATGRTVARQRVVFAAAAVVAAVLVVLLLAVAGLRRSLFPRGSTPTRSLAVLPLVNLSGDDRQEYFADGMTEELITRLAKLGNLRVTSRTSVMGYRGTKKKIPEIAKELGVDDIVEGSIVRDGSRIKVTAQVIDGATDRHVWAESYEREMEDILALQSDVAQAIAREVGVTLTPEKQAGLATATRPVIPAAYDAYVRGRHAWNKRGEQDLHDGIRLFQESIDADPTYAPAYAGMADCYGGLGYASYVSPEDSFPRAEAAARKALELDPNLAEAHASLGFARMYYDWDFEGAETEYRRAIEINPSYGTAHQWRAYLLTARERPETEVRQEIAAAKKLDPLSVPINTDLAYMLYYYGKTEEALKAVHTALEMNPKFPLGHFWLGRIYTSQGRYADAEEELQKIGGLRTWTPAMAVLGYLYGKSGKREDAEAMLREFADLSRQGRYASSYAIAVVHAGLGDWENVFRSLDAAFRERSHWLVWLKRDPRWDEVRTNPRFRELVRKVGLPI